MVKFIISSVPAKLTEALAAYSKTSTVEAEYGEVVVEGTVRTRAHHGSRKANPCPCLAANVAEEDRPEIVGGSHFDLDALGGYLAEIGQKPEAPGFWQLAAFVDTNGPHKLAQSGAADADIHRLHGYWAWAQLPANRVMPPRDGSIIDVTDKAMEAKSIIERLLGDDAELLAAGVAMKQGEDALNKDSFLECRGDVVIRKADAFTNHLYTCPDGTVCGAVVALNMKLGGVTVSLAEPMPGVSCRAIVQSVWTDKDEKGQLLAGGHEGIAGSPRHRPMTEEDLEAAATATVVALDRVKGSLNIF